jgi:hypothetical protein
MGFQGQAIGVDNSNRTDFRLAQKNMYRIEKTDYGFYITFSGRMSEAEAVQFKEEVENMLPSLAQSWSSIIDLRTWIPAEPKVLMFLEQVERFSRDHGLKRRAIIAHSPVIKSQASQLSFVSETNDLERFIDASKVENWEELAVGWAAHGVEPTVILAGISSAD